MSVQSEITRLASAKSNIAAAIEEKGVEVPEGTALDGMAELIGQIPSGGNTDAEDAIIARTITEYENDRVKTVGNYAFNYCTALTSAKFPAATIIGNYAFNNCSVLASANFPEAKRIGTGAFRYCYALTSVNLPAATVIESEAFNMCSAITDLVVGTNNGGEVCTYSNTYSSYDPQNTNLKIYVPDSLVSSYKSATNWSRLAKKIYGISTRPTD